MLPGLPDNMVAGFQGQQRDREGGRKRGKICVAFFDLTSDVIQHHFYYILSVKEPFKFKRRKQKAHILMEVC